MVAPRNAYLNFNRDGDQQFHFLWVNEISQDLNLGGSTSQSRLQQQFYPRSHVPGDLIIMGQCESQTEYQTLSRFLRGHHRVLMNTPAEVSFSRNNLDSAGYQRLLKFFMPSEGLLVRGFASTFSIQKRGVFDPAPEFQIAFTIIYDLNATDIMISHQIKKYYDPYIDKQDLYEPPDPDTRDTNDNPSLPNILNPPIPGVIPNPATTPPGTP